MNYEKDAIQCQKARYLPKPLFYAYIQTLAYKDMFGKFVFFLCKLGNYPNVSSYVDKTLSITVEGDIEEAKKFIEFSQPSGVYVPITT